MRLRLTAVCLLAGAVLFPAPSDAQDARRVEVVVVTGVLDQTIERNLTTTLRDAEREDAVLVVVEIDSRGSLGPGVTRRMADAIHSSEVPVVTWIGPPGTRAENGAATLVQAGHVRAMSPGTALGPVHTSDLRARRDRSAEAIRHLEQVVRRAGHVTPALAAESLQGPLSADAAERAGLVDVLAIQLPDLLREIDGRTVTVAGVETTLRTDPQDVSVRFRKGDILGRLQHAVAQPSIAYLLLLLGLVGVVFEVFHPSTGPAGVSGLLSLGLAFYGVAVMDGSWIAVALLVLGVSAMGVDLRFNSLGVFTALGVVGLVAGSLLLFPAPLLRPSPWVLAFGIGGMLAYMLGAMTKVMRDLRAVASGEREVVDPLEELHSQALDPGGDEGAS